MDTDRLVVLAVASGGGHWEQLQLLTDGMSECDLHFATTIPGLAERSGISSFDLVADCNRSDRGALLMCVRDILRIVRDRRPDVVISTGAAPGLIALVIGKLYGAKAIWIDSVANVEQLSMAGVIAGRIADIWLTQWPHLAKDSGPRYVGSLL